MKSGWWGLVLAVLVAIGVAGAARAQEDSEPEIRLRPRATASEQPGEKSEETREELRRAMQPNPGQLQLPGAVDPDVYRLGPGDVLQVSVWGGISRTMTFEVSPEGTVLLPTSGTLKVDGLTLRDGRAEIMNRMRPEFRGVNLDVRLLRPRRFLVFVTGQIKNPGSYDANGTSRVGELVLMAMPLANASLRQIDVVHRDGTRETADLDLFLRTSSQALNPWVRDGDVLHVPIATSFVHVQGAVSRPDHYELGPRDSLRTLLALGGGLVPAADSSRALLVRWLDSAHSESLWVNLEDVPSGRFNPPLRNGDHLYVYFVPQFQQLNEVGLIGQVARPGTYPIRVGRDRVSDLIRAAGGFLPGADLAAIRVRRSNPMVSADDPELQRLLRLSRHDLTNSEYDVLNTKLAGQREEYRIDWSRLQSTPELDVLLLGGDVIQVDRLVNSIRVDGQVRRPGILSFKPGGSVEDYVRSSGGYSERAWRVKTRVTRSVTGQTFLARDVQKLDPGDFIWVPERPDLTFWDQAHTILSAAAEIATVVLAFHAVTR